MYWFKENALLLLLLVFEFQQQINLGDKLRQKSKNL